MPSGGFTYSTLDDLSDIYDDFSPVETPAESAKTSGDEYRDVLRRIVVSLESRKSYPPAGGATVAEFDAQIGAAWSLVDNSTLQTFDEFKAAYEVYYTEIIKDKYGIAFLFQFETEAGNTVRGLL
jgi:polyhydroxyalkanoate synthesis regulator protein